MNEHERPFKVHQELMSKLGDMGYIPPSKNPPFSGILIGVVISFFFWMAIVGLYLLY